MQRQTTKILEMTEKMIGMVPENAPCPERRLAKILVAHCCGFTPGSMSRHAEANKALDRINRSLSSHLCRVAEEKGRRIQLAEILILASDVILNGGSPERVKKALSEMGESECLVSSS